MDAAAPSFAVLLHEAGKMPVVKVSGELDLLTAPRFRETLDNAGSAASEDPGVSSSVVAVDLTGVEFMDSSGINALVGGTRGFREGGGEVRIVACGEPISRTLGLTGLDKIFPVYPDVRSATTGGRGAA